MKGMYKYWTNIVAAMFGISGISAGLLLESKLQILVGAALLLLAVICPKDDRFEEGGE